MHRRARPGPVAHLHRVVALDLHDVVDLVAVGEAEPRVLAEQVHEAHELGPRQRGEAPLERRGADERLDSRSDRPAPAVHPLDRTKGFERGEETGDRALRQVELRRERGDAGRPIGDRGEDRERSL